MPLGRDSKEKGDYTGGEPPGETESHRLGGLILATYSGKMRRYCWLEGFWDEQEGCERPGPHFVGACMS